MLDLENDIIQMPAHFLPAFRSSAAIERKVEKNILIKTWGGLGDQICAEPTLRYAINTMGKSCDISLASESPELFQHLKFKNIYNLNKSQPIWDNYFVFDTIYPPSHINWQFMSHMLCNCVDYPSLTAFRCQLPISYKSVQLTPSQEDYKNIEEYIGDDVVVVHPGRHWQSKTFPKWWWDKVISTILNMKKKVVIIGADTDDNRGTVDVNNYWCVDLRNKLSVMETTALLMRSKVLLTNDSSPLHMAVPGDAWIGYIATCKHPDMITHYRRGEWSWRMQNHGRGGLWDIVDYCPNREQELSAEFVGEENLLSWLPDAEIYAMWAIEKLK